MTGSGMPMRFSDTNGAMVNEYQAATAMTDESNQSYPFTPDALLDAAVGPQGYFGAFTTNFHTDGPITFENDQTMASAQAHGVPIVAARQMLTWLDGRNGSSFKNIAYSAGTLTFSVAAGSGATGLTVTLPTAAADGLLTSLTLNGSPVSYRTETIKGLEYAIFTAATGTYAARYAAPPGSPSITALSASTTDAGTPTISWNTDRPATSEVTWSEGSTTLDRKVVIAEEAREHRLDLTQFDPGQTYLYRVRSVDQFGHEALYPAPSSPPATLKVPLRLTLPPDLSGVRAMGLPDGTASVRWDTSRTADARVQYGRSATALDKEGIGSGTGTTHLVTLAHMRPGQSYYYRATSRTPWGTAASSNTSGFVMPDYGVADSRLAQWRMGTASGLALARRGDGELRLAAGQNSGTFVSRLLDIQQIVDWRRSLWDADVPAGTTLTVQLRTGSTSSPDTSWTSWRDATGNGDALPSGVTASRYLQYRVQLTGSGGATPVVRAIGFTSTGVVTAYPTEGGG
jgi:hypothetical protein